MSWQRCAHAFFPPAKCRPQSHRPGASQLLHEAHSVWQFVARQSILNVAAAAAWAFAHGDGDSGIFVVFAIIGVLAWVFKSEYLLGASTLRCDCLDEDRCAAWTSETWGGEPTVSTQDKYARKMYASVLVFVTFFLGTVSGIAAIINGAPDKDEDENDSNSG
eukprot:SAG22_NODE_299_length_12768_cov_11.369426_7_plen_162_part_00